LGFLLKAFFLKELKNLMNF